MTRSGLPDYGMYAALEHLGSMVDYGELAARLGSIVTFNREGNIIFWDDFEKTPLKWNITAPQPGRSIHHSQETALSGGQCVRLQTPDDVQDAVGIRRDFLPLISGNLGVEISFKIVERAVDFYLFLIIHTGVSVCTFELKINLLNSDMYFKDNGATWEIVASGLKLSNADHLFHTLKIVLNTDNMKPLRVLLNRTEYSLAAFNVACSPNAGNKGILCKFAIYDHGIERSNLFLDNFILTQNEP